MARNPKSISELGDVKDADEGKNRETDYARVADNLGTKAANAASQALDKAEDGESKLIITGLERFRKNPIPFDETTPLNKRPLYEVVQGKDWDGWFILREGYLYPITHLTFKESDLEEHGLISLQSGLGAHALVSSYPKDMTVYR